VAERLLTYAASMLVDWYGERTGRPYRLASVAGDALPVYVADSPEGPLALAIAALWEPDSDQKAEDARQMMEERLSAGNVRGPHIVWVPPHASVPGEEPNTSEFVMRAQLAAATLLPGRRAEVELPVKIHLQKSRDEGGYANVTGGLSRFWTEITDRVDGTFNVYSKPIHRAPQSESARAALFDRIGERAKDMKLGDAAELDAADCWTVQRLPEEPLGENGFAVAQAPPRIDPADGTLMRRLVRARLRDAASALDGVEAAIKGVGFVAIYEYGEYENVGSFVKSLSPSAYAGLPLIVVVVDGEVRPIFLPR
jgi:hypothetical protein